jgi:hypothetical protein
MWDGTPYLPVGVVCDGTRASILATKAAGITDVVVDLPANSSGWQEAITTLEAQHMHYLIRISSLTPMVGGIAVDPASYRMSDVAPRSHIDIPMPGTSQALVVCAFKRDGTLLSHSKVPVKDGRLVYDVKTNELENVVLVYPTEESVEAPDYWEGLDTQRDRLLQTLKSNPTGPGLRGFVNPLGKTLQLPAQDLRFVPQSPGFQSEFATYLEIKYRNVVGALRAWSMPTGIISANETGQDKDSLVTFDDIAQFVPLWAGQRGIGDIYDPKRDRVYTCSMQHSAIWKDLADCISIAESRRYQRIVAAIRQIDDVPVVQEWSGWAVPYEGANPCVDGIGMKAKGSTPNVIANSAAKATSSVLRWPNPGWLPATDVDVDTAESKGKITGIVEDMTSLGARGIFFRVTSPDLLKEVGQTASSRAGDISASQGSPTPIFYPENATNPAQTQRLPGGYWWLPAPFDGDRIDFGAGFYGYRMATPTGTSITLWADTDRRVLLRFVAPKAVKVSALAGQNADVKVTKEGLEVSLTQIPIVLSSPNEIPVPQPAYDQTLAEILVLLERARATHHDFPDVIMMMSDAKASFERNPGGSFLTLRRLLHQLDSFMGRFTWAELESSSDTNFSEVSENHACSGNHAIDLHPLIDAPAGYYAIYVVPIHTDQDEDIWISAKISPEDRGSVTLDISGQHLSITEPPIGEYGSGYSWYHLGTTKHVIGTAQFKLLVASGKPELSADAILFCSPDFKPNGLTCPEISVDTTHKRPKPKRGRRGSKESEDSVLSEP